MMDHIINILALVTLVEMMVFIGLSASIEDFLRTVKDWKLVARGILGNYIVVPAVTVGLLLVFRAHPMVAVGFLVLAVCPAGPYGPAYTAVAKGNVGTAAGLMVILAGLSPVLSPALLNVLVPVVSGNQPLRVDQGKLVVTLLFGQALPLLAGLMLHQYRPGLAARLLRPAGQLTKVLNAAFLALMLYSQFQSLLQIRLVGFLGMLILLSASVAVGWVAGGSDSAIRKAMTLTTAVRNNGVGMVIATSSFAGTPAVTAAVVYGLVAFLGALAVAMAWGRMTSPVLATESGAVE
jgi:bile acid:Na+ symporter, BASS family